MAVCETTLRGSTASEVSTTYVSCRNRKPIQRSAVTKQKKEDYFDLKLIQQFLLFPCPLVFTLILVHNKVGIRQLQKSEKHIFTLNLINYRSKAPKLNQYYGIMGQTWVLGKIRYA